MPAHKLPGNKVGNGRHSGQEQTANKKFAGCGHMAKTYLTVEEKHTENNYYAYSKIITYEYHGYSPFPNHKQKSAAFLVTLYLN